MKLIIFFGILYLSAVLYAQKLDDGIENEAVTILQQYLAIDTSNPPGNELKGAEYLKKLLDKEGIENQIFDIGSERANLFAIVRGNGEKKPVILLHHIDVVPASSNHWKIHPFSGAILDGEIYGRGAVDIKGKGVIDLVSMIQMKRWKYPLKRDIIFLAVADEEMNSLGTRWMIENKPELIQDAEFLIDEGACVIVDEKGPYQNYVVTVGEKAPLWLRLSFTGKPGHGSIPIEESATNRALKAANKILNYPLDFVVLPYLKEYIRMLLNDRDITKISGFTENFEVSLKNVNFLTEIAKNPEIRACISNTIAITCLQGSDKINTIPNVASIGLDCRLLPGTDKDNFIQKLKEVIHDDTVHITIEEFSPSTCSSWDNDFSKALNVCAKKRNPDAKVVPSILLSSTDSTYYRSLGIRAYGFEPYQLTFEQRELAHSNDERISVANIQFGIALLTDVLKELNATSATIEHIGIYKHIQIAGQSIQVLNVPDVRQSTEYTCGVSCLQAILMYWGKEYRENELAKMANSTPESGTTPENIIGVAKKLGLSAEIKEQMTLDELEKWIQKGIPIIVDIQAWREESNCLDWNDCWEDGHYVIAIGYDEKYIYLEDPSIVASIGYIPKEEFLERWHDYEGEPPFNPKKSRTTRNLGIILQGEQPTIYSIIQPID